MYFAKKFQKADMGLQLHLREGLGLEKN